MKMASLHPWNVSTAGAVVIQRTLASKVIDIIPDDFNARFAAGADVSFNRFSNTIFAAVTVLSLPGLELVETSTARAEITFPYVPGLLSFRELPALEAALTALKQTPDFVIMDGQGAAHPRRFGLACHAGILIGIPTFGCAKSLLIGEFEEPAMERGARSNIVLNGETIGASLRTRATAKPVFISTGHLIDLDSAVSLALACAPKFRIPEPVRSAHSAANAERRKYYTSKAT